MNVIHRSIQVGVLTALLIGATPSSTEEGRLGALQSTTPPKTTGDHAAEPQEARALLRLGDEQLDKLTAGQFSRERAEQIAALVNNVNQSTGSPFRCRVSCRQFTVEVCILQCF